MFTVKKCLGSALLGLAIASFAGYALAHPGHFEPNKKSQKRHGKHASFDEMKGTLALGKARNNALSVSARV